MQKNNLIDLQAVRYMTDQDALLRYADNTPIMPKNLHKDMQNHYAQGSTVQNYALAVTTQQPITLPDLSFGDIKTIQKNAKDHANFWLDNIDKEVIAVFSNGKQYMNNITAFTDKDIDDVMKDLKTGGAAAKVNFLGMLSYWQQGATDNIKRINSLVSDLNTFLDNITDDGTQFKQVDDAAINHYGADKGEMKTLSDSMSLEQKQIQALNKVIAGTAAGLGVGLLAIAIGVLVSLISLGIGIGIVVAGFAAAAAAATLLAKELKQRNTLESQYKKNIIQYDSLQSTCNALKTIAEQFKTLSSSNSKAIDAVLSISKGWSDIATNLGGIASQVDTIIKDDNCFFVVKAQLKAFIADASDLTTIVTQCEANGILPVTTDQATWNLLHIGQRRIPALPNHPIPMGEYLALVKRKNLLEQGFRRRCYTS